jgi:hypothetical protein
MTQVISIRLQMTLNQQQVMVNMIHPLQIMIKMIKLHKRPHQIVPIIHQAKKKKKKKKRKKMKTQVMKKPVQNSIKSMKILKISTKMKRIKDQKS